jgi:hypothetical protein
MDSLCISQSLFTSVLVLSSQKQILVGAGTSLACSISCLQDTLGESHQDCVEEQAWFH